MVLCGQAGKDGIQMSRLPPPAPVGQSGAPLETGLLVGPDLLESGLCLKFRTADMSLTLMLIAAFCLSLSCPVLTKSWFQADNTELALAIFWSGTLLLNLLQTEQWHISLTNIEGAISDFLTSNFFLNILNDWTLHCTNSVAHYLPMCVVLEYIHNLPTVLSVAHFQWHKWALKGPCGSERFGFRSLWLRSDPLPFSLSLQFCVLDGTKPPVSQ